MAAMQKFVKIVVTAPKEARAAFMLDASKLDIVLAGWKWKWKWGQGKCMHREQHFQGACQVVEEARRCSGQVVV